MRPIGGISRRVAVWAPRARRVDVLIGSAPETTVRPMVPTDRPGWWELPTDALTHGTPYGLSVDGTDPVADPRAVWLPDGVHALGHAYDHDRFEWTDAAWEGRPLAGSTVYELHVGTFTPEGTFDAAIDRLEHLVDLGADLVELMPVAAFDGRYGWGYDGVALWAVHEPYGGPDGLKRFVDACHARGLGVLLDVVHNHLGPSGNHLDRFGPYLTTSHQTPWGAAVNLDAPGSDGVREYLLGNAFSWLRDFHLDGLRLDAVHMLVDDRALPFLEELAVGVDRLAAELGRPLSVVAESDRNDPRAVRPGADGGLGLTASWADDLHHAIHAALTGERQGYYVDYGPVGTLAKALATPFVLDGTYSVFRGRSHGRPIDPARDPGHRFVVAAQTHDQVGNRAGGERLSHLVSPGLARVAAALVLTSPYTPMLFMGEEWGATAPWLFFTSFPDPDLGRVVTEGRRREFAAHGWPEHDVPDPQDPHTRDRSVLDWTELDREPHRSLLAWHRDLIALRRTEQELNDARLDRVGVCHDEAARWLVVARGGLRVAANLSDGGQAVPLDAPAEHVLLASAPVVVSPDGLVLPPESVAVVRVSG